MYENKEINDNLSVSHMLTSKLLYPQNDIPHVDILICMRKKAKMYVIHM